MSIIRDTGLVWFGGHFQTAFWGEDYFFARVSASIFT